jgi:quinol monooxygenase YgiN
MIALMVTFNLDGFSDEEFREAGETQWVEPVAAMRGLISKSWLADEPNNVYGGFYLWESREALEEYQSTEFFQAFSSDPRIVNIQAHTFEVMEKPSRRTNGVGGRAVAA